jgi:hypothetical protein
MVIQEGFASDALSQDNLYGWSCDCVMSDRRNAFSIILYFCKRFASELSGDLVATPVKSVQVLEISIEGDTEVELEGAYRCHFVRRCIALGCRKVHCHA